MANHPDPSNLWNPVALWTDIGLRALDMTVNSTQSISESVDRFTRAGASVEASEAAASSAAVPRRAASAASSGAALAADLQRSGFDFMMRGWVQLMSTLGDAVSFGAGLVSPSLTRGNFPLEAMRRTLLPVGWTEEPVTQTRSGSTSRQKSGKRREANADSESMEHALASAEPKRRRSTGTSRPRSKSKARRSRNS
jgi:hypothetical protein